MSKFPKTPSFTGFNAPCRFEGEILDLDVEGEFPAELDGAFYRIMPDPQFPPIQGDDIFFNGDGAITRFRIKDGKVDFHQRWVETDKWKLEQEAGKALFGAYRNPLTDDPSVKGECRGTANTNLVPFGGKLYALKEDSPPVLVDPVTLDTHGYTTFDGKMKGETFTAHPKIDVDTGDMIAFGYASKGICTKDMTYYEVSPEGDLKCEVWFELPYYCMMHDFAITKDYAIFPVVPIVGSIERLEKGMPHFGFDTTLPVYIGVLPRGINAKAENIRWFKRDNCFASHVMNAYQEGSNIHLDMAVAKGNSFPFFPDIHGAKFDPVAGLGYMTRWSVNMDSESDEFESEVKFSNLGGEFPRIDDRYAGKKYRYGWWLGMDPTKPSELNGPPGGPPMNMLGFIDHDTGLEQSWWAGSQGSLQEHAFIPRSKTAPEGDGWIIVLNSLLNDNRCDLLLFNALKISEGPIATAKMPLRLRFGLHGNWADAADVGL